MSSGARVVAEAPEATAVLVEGAAQKLLKALSPKYLLQGFLNLLLLYRVQCGFEARICRNAFEERKERAVCRTRESEKGKAT